MFDLTGKTALITGASGGIGGAVASALHGAGAAVALSGTREAPLRELADRIRTLFAVGDEKQSIYSFQGADAAGLDGQAMVDEYKALVVEYTRERDEKGYPWAPKG